MTRDQEARERVVAGGTVAVGIALLALVAVYRGYLWFYVGI